MGRRFWRQRFNSAGAIAGTTSPFYDGWNLIHEASPSRGYGVDYLWGTDLSGGMQGAGGVGGLLLRNQTLNEGSANSSYKAYYPTYDGNGNVSEYLLANGSVALHLEYDPFGNITHTSGSESGWPWHNIGKLSGVHLFSTKPRDVETGLYYYGYRYYDPVTGRWPSRDPMEEFGGFNLYGMVGNQITGWVDILGLKPGQLYEFGEAVSKALDHAYKDYHALIEKDSSLKDYEFFGLICCKKGVDDSKKYYYTGPLKGVKPGQADFKLAPCGENDSEAGTYHTHPGTLPFSETDMEVTDDYWKVPAFLVDHTNSRNRYDPDPDYDPKKDWENKKNGGKGDRSFWDRKSGSWKNFAWSSSDNKYKPKKDVSK